MLVSSVALIVKSTSIEEIFHDCKAQRNPHQCYTMECNGLRPCQEQDKHQEHQKSQQGWWTLPKKTIKRFEEQRVHHWDDSDGKQLFSYHDKPRSNFHEWGTANQDQKHCFPSLRPRIPVIHYERQHSAPNSPIIFLLAEITCAIFPCKGDHLHHDKAQMIKEANKFINFYPMVKQRERQETEIYSPPNLGRQFFHKQQIERHFDKHRQQNVQLIEERDPGWCPASPMYTQAHYNRHYPNYHGYDSHLKSPTQIDQFDVKVKLLYMVLLYSGIPLDIFTHMVKEREVERYLSSSLVILDTFLKAPSNIDGASLKQAVIDLLETLKENQCNTPMHKLTKSNSLFPPQVIKNVLCVRERLIQENSLRSTFLKDRMTKLRKALPNFINTIRHFEESVFEAVVQAGNRIDLVHLHALILEAIKNVQRQWKEIPSREQAATRYINQVIVEYLGVNQNQSKKVEHGPLSHESQPYYETMAY